MKRQSNKRWQSFLMATIATFIVLAASGSVFTQDKYPKPDFSAMEEYWEIVKFEYDFSGGGVSRLYVVAKPKKKTVPRWWKTAWRDADGVKILESNIVFGSVEIQRAKIGEPVRGSAIAPFKNQMPDVKSTVVISEDPSGGDAETAN